MALPSAANLPPQQPEQKRFKRIVLIKPTDGTEIQQGEVIAWTRENVTVQLWDGTTKTLSHAEVTDRGVLEEDLPEAMRTPSVEVSQVEMEAKLRSLGLSLPEMREIFAEVGRTERFRPLFAWVSWFEKVNQAAWEMHVDLNPSTSFRVPHRSRIPNPIEKDLALLWRYAHRELTGELLRAGASRDPATQDRIFDAHEYYFNDLVMAYLQWRRQQWDEHRMRLLISGRDEHRETMMLILHEVWQTPVQEFIKVKQFPRFTLPETRGGPRSHQLDMAAEEFFPLYKRLQEKWAEWGDRRASRTERIQKISEAFTETLYGLSDPGQLKEVLSTRDRRNLEVHLKSWASKRTPKRIALEIIEWKHGGDITVSSLDTHLTQYRKRMDVRLKDPRLVSPWLSLPEGIKIRKEQLLLRARARW